MQDREFKIGDRVKFNDWEMSVSGTIRSIYGSIALVNVNDLADWYVETKILELEEETTEFSRHSCAPYVGVLHVDNKCVYCNRHMRDTEINEYLHNKVAI